MKDIESEQRLYNNFSKWVKKNPKIENLCRSIKLESYQFIKGAGPTEDGGWYIVIGDETIYIEIEVEVILENLYPGSIGYFWMVKNKKTNEIKGGEVLKFDDLVSIIKPVIEVLHKT